MILLKTKTQEYVLADDYILDQIWNNLPNTDSDRWLRFTDLQEHDHIVPVSQVVDIYEA